ncbi:VC0807 family protein [Pseudonocardia adelaidensis]|uniref:Intracellular septation protein A n=1 Tax=Pseudonocardia adelaidensis TaxID=648754 RepID=A0ABP9NMH1_9PSEU
MNTPIGDAPTERIPAVPPDVEFRPAAMIRGLALDVGLPLVAYYALHIAGVADWPALLAATGVAALRIGWDVARRRRLNLFATVMLVVFGVGLALTLVSGDERFLLVQDSITLSAVALVFLVTSRWGTPLTLAAMQSFSPRKAEALTEAFHTHPEVRHGVRLSSAVWGAGLLALALLRVPLIYLLPVSVMVGLSTVLTVVTFAALIGWNVWYGGRARRGG